MDVLRKQINDELNKYKLSHAVCGYVYLMEGIVLLVHEKVSRNRMVDMYAMLAEKYHVLPKQIEAAIRSCLKASGYEKTSKELMLTVVDEVMYR